MTAYFGDFDKAPRIDNELIQGYGMESAPLVNAACTRGSP
jgi:hypothetical protein